MTDEQVKQAQVPAQNRNSYRDITHVDEVRNQCLAEMRRRIREATDELVRDMGYKIIDAPPPRLRGDAAPGILWGYSLPVERLEMILTDLQNAVVEGSMSAEEAADRAHQGVLEAVQELRYGSHLRTKFFGVPTPLPPAAELGRISAIVERLGEDLATLADDCGTRYSRASIIRVRIHTEQ